MAGTNEAEAKAQMARDNGTNLRQLGPNWASYGPHTAEIYIYDYAVGRVLYTYERNMRDDSDYHAVIWNSETQEPENVMYATTRGWSYPCNAWVDYTPEVEAEYRAWLKARGAESIRYADMQKAKTVEKGKLIRVVKGRKIKKGSLGYCFWIGQTPYGVSVGFQHEDGYKEFTSVKNVEVAGWEAYLPENWEEEVDRRAESFSKGSLCNGRSVGMYR